MKSQRDEMKKITRALGQRDDWAVAIVQIWCTNTLSRSRLYLHSISIQSYKKSVTHPRTLSSSIS